ncbi:rho guanine nucleotide exchange factor 12 isoform 2-T2 [Menidia menidia]
MSGSHSTLTDRTPSILNKDPTDKKPKTEKGSVSLKHEFDPTGLVQRCVIIQRDENGFGLTVSGDNPVFVQLVKKDGAAMRAGVQTGDRIIKVNGTLVTHSNHTEVVKLIKSGSYVALTVLGRPPGLTQSSLDEEKEGEKEGEDAGSPCSLSAPNSPTLSAGGQDSSPGSPQLHGSCSQLHGDRACGSRNGPDKEADGSPPLQDQMLPSHCDGRPLSNSSAMNSSPVIESSGEKETPCQSPDISPRDNPHFCLPSHAEDTPDADSSAQALVGGPPYLLNPLIIGAEDDYFDCQQEQINGQCSCFESIDLLKSRPAHLAVFLHHVVSQFDPVPLLCYLYADMHKQANSKESRRIFMELHSLFLERTANLKVAVPETVAAELEKRKPELIPEDLCKQHSQVLQDSLLADLHRNLEDFRQKRSMGLTLAEDELSKLDLDEGRDQQALEKECSCAEHILSKIEDILLTSQPSEEEKCQTMQYVILSYMRHLGVKVKEHRGLEHKRARMNFLPKIKVKRENLFSNILGPPRRLSRVESTSVGKAVELNKQRSPKLSQQGPGSPDPPDPSAAGPGRSRASQLSEGSDTSSQSGTSTPSLPHSPPAAQAPDSSGPEADPNVSPLCVQPRLSDGVQSGDSHDSLPSPGSPQFDFSPSSLEQQEEDQEAIGRMEVHCVGNSADIQSEDDQAAEWESEEDPLNWQRLVSRGLLASLTPKEIKRQEVINELFYTERAHLRMLRVMDSVFCQRLNRDGIIPPEEIKHIFSNLEEIIQMHVSVTEQMTAIRKRSETSVIGQIGEDLLVWFSEEEEEKIKRAVGTFCSNQPSALELIKTRKRKDQRFSLFMQEAESNRLCRRLQLKDIIPVEMQRVTKYPLLLDNIAKYTEDGEEREKVRKAGECCKKILNHVNQAVKEAENKQRLEEYQRRLDLSSLKPSENPVILELRNLDMTKRKMVHEGPLSWKVNKDKTIELYTILLEDIIVLLQKQDERLVLKFHGKNVASVADTKHIFSPIIKLSTVLVRPVATDNKSFFVLSMSENGAQIYELMAQTVSDQRTWQCLITQCADTMKAKAHNRNIPPAQARAERDAIEIMDQEIPKQSMEPTRTPKKDAHSADVQVPVNPFDDLKSEDEEEDQPVLRSPGKEGEVEGEVEVDEAELEAFLDGQLADRLLQEGSRQGIALENDVHSVFAPPSSKAEEALRTLAALKQALFSQLLSREAQEDAGSRLSECVAVSPGGPCAAAAAACEEGSAPEGPGKDPPQVAPALTGPCEEAEHNNGFVVVDFGGPPREPSADELAADIGIDMRKLLSSSSLTGSGGPNLSRQLMTHLRLLQADLQYLKEVEMKYSQLRQMHGDSDHNTDGIH